VFNLSAALPVEVEYRGISVRYYDIHDTWCRISATLSPPEDVLKSHGPRLPGDGLRVGYEDKQGFMRHLFGMGHAVCDTERVYPLEYYRSTFSSIPGSAEFPSAARPFTLEVIRRLMIRGVVFEYITLHTATQFGAEKPLPEYYAVPYDTINLVDKARKNGKKVIAVGTTCVRALEFG